MSNFDAMIAALKANAAAATPTANVSVLDSFLETLFRADLRVSYKAFVKIAEEFGYSGNALQVGSWLTASGLGHLAQATVCRASGGYHHKAFGVWGHVEHEGMTLMLWVLQHPGKVIADANVLLPLWEEFKANNN